MKKFILSFLIMSLATLGPTVADYCKQLGYTGWAETAKLFAFLLMFYGLFALAFAFAAADSEDPPENFRKGPGRDPRLPASPPPPPKLSVPEQRFQDIFRS